MAGTIQIKSDTRWSAASWLFDWVLNDLATTISDVASVQRVQEIVRFNLGWLSIDELPEKGQGEALDALCQSLVEHADRKLPPKIQGREQAIQLLRQLAEMACQRLGGR